MSQNRSSAVMAQRTAERKPHPLAAAFAAAGLDRDMLDDFPTQPWGGRAWCEHVVGRAALAGAVVWEPAANRGFLAKGLRDYCGALIESDIFAYRPGLETFNFLDAGAGGGLLPGRPSFAERGMVDWVVTNPPFSRAEEFIHIALELATVGIAMLCRAQITETVGRYTEIFVPWADHWCFSQFVERLPMQEGICRRDMSTASAYGWLTIWKAPQDPAFLLARRHIPPCRKRLERPGDYELAA